MVPSLIPLSTNRISFFGRPNFKFSVAGGETDVFAGLKSVLNVKSVVCVKDLSGLGSSHDPLIVSYAVTGGYFFSF